MYVQLTATNSLKKLSQCTMSAADHGKGRDRFIYDLLSKLSGDRRLCLRFYRSQLSTRYLIGNSCRKDEAPFCTV